MRSVAFILLLSLACAAFGAGERLHYVRGGDIWHIPTANIAHYSWDHLAWDGLAFLFLGLVCAQKWPFKFHWTLMTAAILTPLAAMPTYRGLSGIDSALFALAACRIMIEQRGRDRAIVAIAFAGFLAKIGFELATGSTLFVHELAPGVVALPMAHVIGAAVGIFSALAHAKGERSGGLQPAV